MRKDRQLAVIDVQNAKRKLSENLPLTLKELAIALEVGYDTALAWRRQPGFPYDFGKVFPSDFEHWRRQRLGIPCQYTHPNPQNTDIEAREISPMTYGLPAGLPQKAARLAARAGLCR